MSRTDVRRFSIYIPARWSEKHFSEKWATPLLSADTPAVQTSLASQSREPRASRHSYLVHELIGV